MTTNPNVAGKRHRELMQAHYGRLQSFSLDAESWLEVMRQNHVDFYQTVLDNLAESSRPEDQEMYNHLDLQYTRMLSSLQAASERIIEAGAHIKRALVHPGDPLAHLKNVTQDTFK